MIKVSTSKGLSFVALMAALGNVLSFISIQLSPIVPSIPLGPVNFSLALDLSHLATFIAALLGGPVVGGLTGLVGGFVSAFQFGFSQGNIITGIGLPLGKAMTGIVAGILFQRISVGRWKTLAVTVISYIPEAIFTAFIFIYLYPIFYGLPTAGSGAYRHTDHRKGVRGDASSRDDPYIHRWESRFPDLFTFPIIMTVLSFDPK